jgi:ATP-dependent Lhr-like helicase
MTSCRDSMTTAGARPRRIVLEAFFGSFAGLRPIQTAAYPPILQGDDALIVSSTGSGKTEAAIAPLVDRWYEELASEQGAVLLYVCPTKALINDLRERLHRPCAALGLSVAIRHGDRSDLARSRAPGILITTPESVDVLLARADATFAQVRAVVFDEAHLLYNAQRGLQTSILLRRLEQRLRRRLQIVSMSATVANPAELVHFLFGDSRSMNVIRDAARRSINAHIRILNDAGQLRAVVEKLAGARPAKLLLFANSRRECDAVASVLRESDSVGSSVLVHYSSLSAELREDVERRFSAERRAVCVATSTLELGIDIGDIDAVLLYGAPHSHESFLQRIGRGNRRGDEANVVCLVPNGSPRPLLQVATYLAILERVEAGSIERERAYSLFGAAVQQLLSCLHERRGAFVRVADLTGLVASRDHLDRSVIEAMLSHLAVESVLMQHGFKNQFGAGEGFHRLAGLRLLHGNYPAGSTQVTLVDGSRELGRVHSINLLRLDAGSKFRFAGRVFQVTRVHRDRLEVQRSSPHGVVHELVYPGTAPGIHASILVDVWRMLADGRFRADLMTQTDREWVGRKISVLGPLLADGGIPMAVAKDGLRHFTLASRLVHRAIALAMNESSESSDDVWFAGSRPLELGALPESLGEYEPLLGSLLEPGEQRSLFQALLPPELAVKELGEAWLKTPAHEEILARLRSGRVHRVGAEQLESVL